MGVKIISTGSFFPDKVLTNQDLEKMVDTTDEWITTRTGIKERRIADNNTATSDLAIAACRKTIENTGITAQEIDLIIVATITPDMFFPATACLVQKGLGAINATAFDISAACTGFIYGLACAKGFLEAKIFKTALVVGAETLSKITNWKDRNTCVLFGDGAGAMLLRYDVTDDAILSIYLGSDGNYDKLLFMPAGGSRLPASIETVNQNLHYIHMQGRETFKIAVTKMVESIQKTLALCNKTCEDLALIIPHQANLRIIDAMAEKLNVPKEKIFVNLDRFGNVSSATTIAGLDEAIRQKRVKHGDLVALVAFGSGVTWGGIILKI